ncbi:MAG: hypothetical protein N2422_07775, partial [Rhodobacteraceae bacterium]|nr:hypothetical protein [Paracoccaceae bacterium]
MKPNFALELSQDGIVLLHRGASGWFRVGSVDPNAEGLAEGMAVLRRSALALEPSGFATKLVLPPSQILYARIEAPGPDAADRRRQIAAALDGRTPYEVTDLVFDWSGTGPVVQVAVVARVTLEEAESFAEEFRLNPVAFVASPGPGQFAGEPFFGQTARAADHLPKGARLDRDEEPVKLAPAPVPREAAAAAAEGAGAAGAGGEAASRKARRKAARQAAEGAGVAVADGVAEGGADGAGVAGAPPEAGGVADRAAHRGAPGEADAEAGAGAGAPGEADADAVMGAGAPGEADAEA